ncbi:PREDICTED: uncharacterized protein LOC104020564 [Nipponia nippon]|uniref:uncharacterized protein LOC104020564 n=1 Tax=Nipponia nippon TaxID=128390 RepID=UPI00051136F4|nr:PREDICTED: uncharacterized protein LOC104020564 [Nipponia nippon]
MAASIRGGGGGGGDRAEGSRQRAFRARALADPLNLPLLHQCLPNSPVWQSHATAGTHCLGTVILPARREESRECRCASPAASILQPGPGQRRLPRPAARRRESALPDLCKNCHHLIARHEYTFSVVDDYQRWCSSPAASHKPRGRGLRSLRLIYCRRPALPRWPRPSAPIEPPPRGSFGGDCHPAESWGRPAGLQPAGTPEPALLGQLEETLDVGLQLDGGHAGAVATERFPFGTHQEFLEVPGDVGALYWAPGDEAGFGHQVRRLVGRRGQAVNALCIIGTEEAFGVIDRKKLLEYLHSLKQPDGSFLMHVGGEVDVRWAPGGDAALSMARWMFDQSALQEYILLCCQCPAGGLLDKPGKSRDFYHTCYCLSGLAIAQHFGSGDLHHEVILGVPENRLQATHPVYNIAPEKVVRAVMHFLQQPVPSPEPTAAAE